MPAKLLAFDTATENMAVALHAGGHTLAWNGPGGAGASAQLLPRIFELLAQAGVALGELDAIAYGRGPGAFTGLRTACAVAQGLALGAALPVLGVDSLLIVAEDARQALRWGDCEIDVAMDARMAEIYAACYAYQDGAWRVLRAPRLCSVAWLNAQWASKAAQCVAGSAVAAFGAALASGEAARVTQPRSRALALMACAQALWAQGGAVDAAEALPLYLRDQVAQTSAERAAAKALK